MSLEFYTINITHSVTAEDFRSVLTGNQIGLIYTCLKNSLYLCTYITKNFQKTLMMYAIGKTTWYHVCLAAVITLLCRWCYFVFENNDSTDKRKKERRKFFLTQPVLI